MAKREKNYEGGGYRHCPLEEIVHMCTCVGLAFARCTDGPSIVTEVKTEYWSPDARRWEALVVGACGNSFLIASIFPEK